MNPLGTSNIEHRTSNACSPCALRLLTPTLYSFSEEREKAVATFRFMVGAQFKKKLGLQSRIVFIRVAIRSARNYGVPEEFYWKRMGQCQEDRGKGEQRFYRRKRRERRVGFPSLPPDGYSDDRSEERRV